MLERLKAGWEGDDRGRDGWMASLTRWTWVWVGSGRWWWTGKPGVLQSMGFPRVGHDWTEPKESTYKKTHNKSYHMCRNLEYTPFKVINLICMPTITISPQQCDGSSSQSSKKKKKNSWWTSLVAQWMRNYLWMQRIWVWSLIRDNSTCCRATKPMWHKYWAHVPETASHYYWAHMSQLLKYAQLKPVRHNKRILNTKMKMGCHSLQLEKALRRAIKMSQCSQK